MVHNCVDNSRRNNSDNSSIDNICDDDDICVDGAERDCECSWWV